LQADNCLYPCPLIDMEKLSRKEQIKEAAARMFRIRGYTATSMRDIAAELQMEAPSLYNHIKGKQEILKELLMTIAHAFTDGMAEVRTSKLNSIQQLERLIKLHVEITLDYTDAAALITNEWVHLEGKEGIEFKSLKDKYEEDFKEVVQQCHDQGYIVAVDVELTVFSILSTLRWLYSWCQKNEDVNKMPLEQSMVDLLVPYSS